MGAKGIAFILTMPHVYAKSGSEKYPHRVSTPASWLQCYLPSPLHLTSVDRCISQARKPPSRFKFFKYHKPLQLSWSTTILMLAGDIKSYQPTTQYAVNTLRSAFFASIEQLIFLTPLRSRNLQDYHWVSAAMIRFATVVIIYLRLR